MSFLNIKDPKKRDAIVADYLATVKILQQRNLNEKAQDLAKSDELNEMFNPVVESTKKSTEAITKELVPLQEEMKTLNDHLNPKVSSKHQRRKGSSTNLNVLEYYLTEYNNAKIDKYFGIEQSGDDKYMMGDKDIVVDKESNIHVDGIGYKGTPGLWMLIMLKTLNDSDYTSDDLDQYRNLAKQTNVMLHPRNLKSSSRPTTTWKWNHILAPILQRVKKENIDGDGIQFLPSDIKGLTSRLHLLLAEFAAGNRSSTRNEIVFILDALLRRKNISRKEYVDINSYLSRCL